MRDFLFTTPPFARLTDFAGLWAMEPTAMGLLLESIRRMDLSAHVREGMMRPTPVASTMELIPTKGDKRVALVKATGKLMKPQSSMGGTSTIQLRRDIRQAANDPSVSGILLAIESPGGAIAGTAELANDVKAARRKKPVWAHVDDMAASAAYWVASQAGAIYANHATALVGNVGTVYTVMDTSKAAEKEGVQVRVFSTGPLKAAGYAGTTLTDDQARMFQALADENQTHFDAAVRAGRSLTAKEMEAVRTGEIFSATRAKELRLIDGIRPLEATLSALADAH